MSANTRKKAAPKRATRTTRASRAASNKVDYYPNRVALLTATAAVLILLVLGMITAM